MESIANLLNEISVNNFDIGSDHWVDVTHINNPHSFYVRPTVYRTYLPILHTYDDQPLPTELHVGWIVIYKSNMRNSYLRGRVMFIQEKDEGDMFCDVFALDYGFFEKSIPLDKVRKTFYSMDVPPLAIHCHLADCKPLTEDWSDVAIESMKFFVGKERAKMVVRGKSPGSLTVELFNSCPEDIATMLAYDGRSTLGYSNNIVNRFSAIESEKHYYRFKEYDVGEILTVRVQSGDSLKSFFVAQIDEYRDYLQQKNNFTCYCKNQKNLDPEYIQEGMAAGTLMVSSNDYERALVTEIIVPNDRVKVMLVDWGKFIEVPVSRLKPMADNFFLRPASAILCSAEENQTWDNELHKYLYPGYEFKMTIVKLGEQYESPHVVRINQR